uniref:Uncharacterized protein n=1 Tax=Noccaea caerulescens TaxID=107243 RepID=A0A1J3EU88_NOCCA
MGNHCTRTPSCRKMWSFISSNINSNKSQARTLSGPDHLAALAPLSIGECCCRISLGCGHEAGPLFFGFIVSDSER